METGIISEKLFSTVLLIEDEDAHALIITRALRSACEKVVRCKTFNEAVLNLQTNTYQLIITDLNLPDKPQGGAVKALRGEVPQSFVVVLTSSTALKDAIDAMKNGAHDFIVKAFDQNFNEALNLALSRVWSMLVAAEERQKLQRETEMLRVSIENSKDGLAIVDDKAEVYYSNRSFENFAEKCGGEKNNLRDLFTTKVARAENLKKTILEKLETLTSGAVWTTEVTFVSGQSQAFELSFSPLPARTVEGPRYYVLWIRDISDQKQREKFQRDILSTTTHDLKGPLGAILLSADMLERQLQENIRSKEIAIRIGSSAQGAINLIDEFLSARRIQEGTFVLKPNQQDIGHILTIVIGDFETIAKARGIGLDLKLPQDRILAEVDKLGLVRVVGNLLSNALKFSQKGGQVSLQLASSDGEFHIRVSDTGCGMEPSEVQRLFERFSRLEKHREVAGTGLGLYVVKAIVNAHGGKIEVTSKVGEGTTFDLAIPLKAPVNERGELYSLSFA